MTAALYPQEGSKLRKWNGYSDFKDSMVPWIGPVPRNWGVGPVKRCCSFRAGSGFPHEEQGLTEGDLPFYKVGDMNSGGNDLYLHRSQNYVTLHTARRLGATIFAAGTIVFPKVGAALLTNKRRMLAQPACIDNNVMGMTVRNGVRKWFYYWFSTIDLGRLANPGAVPSINESQVKDIVLALPPVHDQEAITCFLDRETAKIDTLIAKKQRLIELLQEKRAALISHAVTKGLTGLGESAKRYTEMWTETRLGRAIKLQRGFDITGAADGMGDIPVISSGGFSGQCSIPIVRGPGVIVGRKGTLGTVHFCEGDFWPHDTTLWVREFGGNHPRFVYYFLLHMRLESYDVGAANPTLNRNHVHPLIVRWPDVESQRRIAEYLDRASETVDPLIAKVNEAISRLREYRTALISAAVTGKIDVRGEAE